MRKHPFYKYYSIAFVLLLFVISCDRAPSKRSSQRTLVGVKITDRISSNHYAELVKDADGNSYTACFEKKNDGKDYMFISKLNPDGSIVWELGNENRGRATAISINEKNNIVVAGWFHQAMQLGGKTIENDENGQSFIAEVSPNGTCVDLKSCAADGIFNIHYNTSGERLVSGIVSDRIIFDAVVYNNDAPKQVKFLAYFDKSGKCKWIEKYDAKLVKINSYENNFYLTGKFSESFVFASDGLKTKGSFDSNGFVHKINQQGVSQWIKAFGIENTFQKIAYLEETGCDLAFDQESNVLVCALKYDSPTNMVPSLNIIKYNTEGVVIDEKLLVKNANNSIYTFTRDDNNNYWLTGSVKNTLLLANSSWKTFAPVNSYILKLNSSLDCEDVILPKHGVNTLFRSAYYSNSSVSFTGHYKSFFSYKEDSIFNTGKNELFLYTLPID